MTARTKRVRPWEERPPHPDIDLSVGTTTRAEKEAMLAHRIDQYRHGETNWYGAYFWWSWLESDKGRMWFWYYLAMMVPLSAAAWFILRWVYAS